jgi:hypothetical protein
MRVRSPLLLIVATLCLVACSSDTPTGPEPAFLSLPAAPTISVQKSIVWAHVGLCYPGWAGSTRGCPSGGYHQYWGWDPQPDIEQERDLDQEVARIWHRAVYHEGLGERHRFAPRRLFRLDQNPGDGSDQQPGNGVGDHAPDVERGTASEAPCDRWIRLGSLS